MSALSVADILTRVQRQFGDEAGVQVTQADVIRWINDAQREIVMQHEGLYETTATASTVAGTAEVALPADNISLQEVLYMGAGDSSYFNLRYVTADEHASMYFDLGSGDPVYYIRSSNGYVTLLPTPDSSLTDSIKFVYNRYSQDVAAVGDALDVPEYYHQVILEYCLMKAYEMDENWEAADRKSQYVQSTIDFNNGRGSWLEHKTYPIVSEARD
jgi:hypothetical protein